MKVLFFNVKNPWDVNVGSFFFNFSLLKGALRVTMQNKEVLPLCSDYVYAGNVVIMHRKYRLQLISSRIIDLTSKLKKRLRILNTGERVMLQCM